MHAKQTIKSVWVIDDDALYLFAIQKLIAHYQLCENVTTFTDAAVALEQLQAFDPEEEGLLPDIILLDIKMPGMNGWMFIEAFINLPFFIQRNTGIVLVSSSKDENEVARSISLPMVQAYLVKPVSIEEFEPIFKAPRNGFF